MAADQPNTTGPETPPLAEAGLRRHQAGRLDEAETLYQQALAVRPDDAVALHLLGALRHQQGRFLEAVDLITKAVAIRPDYPEAFGNLGLALYVLGRLPEAETAFRQALLVRPDYPEAHTNLGNLLHQRRRVAEAEASYREVVRLQPDSPGAHSNLANALRELGRLAEAEATYREALRLRPDFSDAHSNLGNVLRDLGHMEEAAASYREALRLRPDYPEACNNLGVALSELGRLVEAEASYRAALRLQPDFHNARCNLAYSLLLAGRFEEGWAEHEGRWKTTNLSGSARRFPVSQWSGEAIGDRVVLLHAEQGLGDTLQFCRYVPLVASGARVVLEVQDPLVRLLSWLPGITEIVAKGDRLPLFDLHCPLMSLPYVFGTTLDTVPAVTPYLSADPELAADWRERLAGLDGLKVGLVWAGGRRSDWPEHVALDRRRTVALDTLAPLAEASGVSFVSLQKDAAGAQAANPPRGMTLHNFTADLQDFADTAALLDGLDLVISVDTAVVHLAGALGKPVWLLNRFDTCWRWMLNRDDSPWYPTLRQFRQSWPGDWTSVIDVTRDALRRLAAGDRDQLRPRQSGMRR